MRTLMVMTVATLALAGGCGSSNDNADGTCSRSAFDVDGATYECSTYRTILRCTSSSVEEVCPSDDSSKCIGGTTISGSCKSVCADDEYGAVCGGIGPGHNADAPPGANCGTSLPTPAGAVYYCCPCR